MPEKLGIFFTKAGVLIKQYMVIIVLVVVLLAAWQGWSAWGKYKASQISAAMVEDAKYKAAIKVMDDQINTLKAEKARMALVNIDLALDVENWRAKAKKNPPPAPVPDPPKDIAVVVEQVKASGVPFVLSTARPGDDPLLGNATTGTKFLPMVWKWSKDSERVPQLEIAYSTAASLNGALTTQVFGLEREVVKSNEIIAKHEVKDTEQAKRIDNMAVIQKDLVKQVRRENINGYIKAGAAFVTAFFLGKAVK